MGQRTGLIEVGSLLSQKKNVSKKQKMHQKWSQTGLKL